MKDMEQLRATAIAAQDRSCALKAQATKKAARLRKEADDAWQAYWDEMDARALAVPTCPQTTGDLFP